MELRFNFYGDIPEVVKSNVEKSYNEHIGTFSIFAKVYQSTLFYIDRVHRKVYFASYNPEILSYNFEGETKVDFWMERLSEESASRLATINLAISQFSTNEAKEYGWNFSVSYSLTMHLDGAPLNLSLLGIPVEVVDNELVSILYMVTKSTDDLDDKLAIAYQQGPSLQYNFNDGQFYLEDTVSFAEDELSIVKLSGLGFNEDEISSELELPVHDVKRIKYNLFLKLKVKNMPQALFTLHRLGLLD